MLRDVDFRRYSSRTFALLGGVGLLLLFASVLIEVRIVVDRPHLGDVSAVLGAIWQLSIGLATLGSFLLAGYNHVRSGGPSDGTVRALEIRGRNHDIDVHLNVPNPGGENADESVQDASDEGRD